MTDTTKAVLIALGLPAIGGFVGAVPGMIVGGAGSASTDDPQTGLAIGGVGLALMVVGGFVGSYYVAKAIVKA